MPSPIGYGFKHRPDPNIKPQDKSIEIAIKPYEKKTGPRKLRILLVEPEFPIPSKSRNHKNYLPIGLLKLAAFYKKKGHLVKLVRGNLDLAEIDFEPDQVGITSLFTYWREHVKKSVEHYRSLFPKAKILVGGIYATLMPNDCRKFTGCDEVYEGVHEEAESAVPDYSLVSNPHELGYQIIHTSRGCIRKCKFCGVRRIEPRFVYKKSIIKDICSNKLVFYDNNILANPHIKRILNEITEFRYRGKHVSCESQCGFDGRLLTPEIAKLIRKARFRDVRIAWDGPYSSHKEVAKQVNMLTEAGYNRRDLFIFMIYNWEITFKEMEKKREKCKEWRVQIADCRYRPLNQKHDDYNPRKKQTKKDYYIDPEWTDALVKLFRKNVREQNICIRMGFASYNAEKERDGERQRRIRKALPPRLRSLGYNIIKVRQVEIVKGGYIVYCKTSDGESKFRISEDLQPRLVK